MEKCKIVVLKESEVKQIEEIIKKVLKLKKGGEVLIDESLLERVINDVINECKDKVDNNTIIRYMAVNSEYIKEEDVEVTDNKYYKDNVLIEDAYLDDNEINPAKVKKKKKGKNK